MNYNDRYWAIQNHQIELINSLIRLTDNVMESMNENNRQLNFLNTSILELINRSTLFGESTRRYLNSSFHDQTRTHGSRQNNTTNNQSHTANNRRDINSTPIEQHNNQNQDNLSPITPVDLNEARHTLAHLYNMSSPLRSINAQRNLVRNNNQIISNPPINLEAIADENIISPILPTNFSHLIESIIIPNSPPPINIPTIQQIRNNTAETLYQYLPNPLNTTCAISHMVFEPNDVVIKINYCGHIFIKNELLQWFNRSPRCPLCRYSILSNTTRSRVIPTHTSISRQHNFTGTSSFHSRNEHDNEQSTYFRRHNNTNSDNDNNDSENDGENDTDADVG